MLELTVKGVESFNNDTQKFFTPDDVVLRLEHSLVSLHRWESKWKKAFLSQHVKKTPEEMLGYIEAMCIEPPSDPTVFYRLSEENNREINAYLEDSMTATTFAPSQGGGSRETVTAEIIYYWMVALQIPHEFSEWHLSKLFALIRVTNAKNAPKKKMSRQEAMAQQRAANAQRRAEMKSNG